MKKLGHTIFAYIDDYIIVSSKEEADKAFNQLSELLNELGLPMNPYKWVSPNITFTCLGINIAIACNILSIDSHKLQAIYNECCMVRHRKRLNKKGMQSLLVKLIYIHKCVKPRFLLIEFCICLGIVVIGLYLTNIIEILIGLSDVFQVSMGLHIYREKW